MNALMNVILRYGRSHMIMFVAWLKHTKAFDKAPKPFSNKLKVNMYSRYRLCSGLQILELLQERCSYVQEIIQRTYVLRSDLCIIEDINVLKSNKQKFIKRQVFFFPYLLDF